MIRTSKSKVYLCIGFFLLLFPAFNVSLLPYLKMNTAKHYFYVVSVIFIFAYRNESAVFRCKKEIFALLAAMLIMIYWRSAMPNTMDAWQLPYLALVGIMLLLHLDDQWWSVFRSVIRCYSAFHLVTGIALLFVPNFVINNIVPMFELPSATKRVLISVIQQRYITGLTDHYTKMAIYLSLGVFAFAKPLLSGGGKVKWKDWILFGIFLVGLIMSGKRGPFLFTVIALVFIYWLCNRPFTVRQYRQTFLLLLASLIAILVMYFTIPQFRSLLGRFMIEGDANTVSNGRFQFYWLNAIQLFLEKPFLGHGWRSFRMLNQTRFGFDILTDAHNIYLQLAAEIGIVGLTIFLVFFIGAFVMTYKAFKMQKQYRVLSVKQVELLEYSLAEQVFFILYGFSENPLYDNMCYIPYFMCCVLGYSAWYRLHIEQKKRIVERGMGQQ